MFRIRIRCPISRALLFGRCRRGLTGRAGRWLAAIRGRDRRGPLWAVSVARSTTGKCHAGDEQDSQVRYFHSGDSIPYEGSIYYTSPGPSALAVGLPAAVVNFRNRVRAEFPIKPTRPLTRAEISITFDVQLPLLRTRKLRHRRRTWGSFYRLPAGILTNLCLDRLVGLLALYAFFAPKCCICWRTPNGEVQKFRRRSCVAYSPAPRCLLPAACFPLPASRCLLPAPLIWCHSLPTATMHP